jgi:hypothetical protein
MSNETPSSARGPDRREILRRGLMAIGGVAVGGAAFRIGVCDARVTPEKGLLAPDANGLRLPPGFESRVVARSSRPPVPGRPYRWHGAPDGGATFAAPDGGWVYVSNSEQHAGQGGCGALRFDSRGTLVDAYSILSGTTSNCAGGPTPWGTWFSCEEFAEGRVWECDPFGKRPAGVRPALGVFNHEAAAVDLKRGCIYLTEDEPDGLLYRFTPARPSKGGRMDLSEGRIDALTHDAKTGQIGWEVIPDPLGRSRPTRDQHENARIFAGGEGCWLHGDTLFFTTKYDNTVWTLDLAAGRLSVLYASQEKDAPLRGVDNVTVSSAGEVLVAEDGGAMRIVGLGAQGAIRALVQIDGHPWSEVTGPAFDPSGRRLYFSSQRGAANRNEDGVTYEVTGPFDRIA